MKPIKNDRKLQLSKQTLRALTGEALAQVAGGGSRLLVSQTCPSRCQTTCVDCDRA